MRKTSLALFLSLSLLPVGLAHAGGGQLQRSANGRPIELYHPAPSPKGTVLMFHGFTATPKQWAAEAQLRYAQGYDVVVAALPGHAFVDAQGVASSERVLKVNEADGYTRFARGMYEKAAARSHKVHVVGISVGGAHALEVAMREKHRLAPDGTPVIRSVVAVNPYLGPTPKQYGPLRIDESAFLSRLDGYSFGLLGKALSRRDKQFNVSLRERVAPETIGLRAASYGALLAVGRFADSVMARARDTESEWGRLDVPSYVVVSDKDPMANPKKGHQIARLLGATTVRVEGGVHDLASAHEPGGAFSRWQVKQTISRALKAGEARTRLW